jgi:hypothetical protein
LTPYFIAFELIIYALFFLCFIHAWRSGPAVVWQLVGGVLFGILLEYGTIQELQAYSYGRFLIMLGDVPLPIGVAWGCIVYSARLFSDASNLPAWARPLLDGLLALNIDLSMDTIAIRLGFWNWAINMNSQFFGVPYANFWAWFWVVASFSAGLRLVMTWKNPLRSWLAPLGALFAGLVIVFMTNQFIYDVYRLSFSLYILSIALVLGGALLLVFLLHPHVHAKPESAPAIWVPLSFHAFFLVAGAVSGIYFRTPALLFVSLLMAAIGIMVHRHAIFS